ncbi:Acyl-CoA dehydrogenase (plasmid) [Variovorax sp. SRS16]|uniref:acyl-CoA dehydrogenase family protein n=1 Tax=Variovorax sp. SRS16 TaxID=282217 RepID=UPI0013172F79|nr:acyl-CoA dehydrogenase family protein [Variovorax sp. SRS16]VTU46310.1 Acyl-CoA dehydrogenase [Variovorax sp. SRS16]
MALDYSFSQEHESFRAFVRGFAREGIQPYVVECDEKERFPVEAIRHMGKAGLLGIIAPKRLGGMEGDYIMLGIAVEEIARVDNSCAMICSMQNTLPNLVPGWGEEAARGVISGERLVCIATSETEAGSDLSNMSTIACVEDGHFVINGEKIHVSLMPGAALMGVTAKVQQPDGSSRITFIRVPADAPGVSCELMPEMGLRSHQLGIVRLKDVRVPVEHTLGGEGQGKAVLYARWNVSRCLSALNALGAAQQVLDDTIEFVKKKEVYGKAIGHYQAISFPLVEHSTRVEAGRMLAYRGLWMNTRGENAARIAGMAKWSGITDSIAAIQDCLQMFGASGYLKALPLERRLRDVLGLTFTGGTINVMKLTVVKELLGASFMDISG